MAMTRIARCTSAVVFSVTLVAAVPARADFFDGMRKTFTNDLPHFFQDDVPCAFGGQPTSHTRKSCNSPKPQDKPKAARQPR
jgi:hypothetical protein